MLSEENNLGFYSKLIQKEWIAEVEVALTGFAWLIEMPSVEDEEHR